MVKLILTLLPFLLLSSGIYSQVEDNGIAGKSIQYQIVNGIVMQKIVTNAVKSGSYSQNNITPPPVFQNNILNNSMVRWSYTDPIAIGDRNATSGTGLYEVVGWGLNTQRVSLYNNAGNTPIWEYSTDPNTFTNHVTISDTGGVIASGSYKKIFAFNRASSTPILNFDLTSFPITSGVANAIDITSNGNFIIAGTSPSIQGDSSYILGFYKDSTQPAWKITVGQTAAGGSGVYGVKIAAYDTLAIVNTYGGFYIIRTYSGQIVYQGLINPSSNNGTQAPQAISGDGSYIATINYNGFVRVYQRSGNTYNFLWQHQEPPGTYYNWMTTVDISTNGQYLACGTLNFLSSSSYDGKVKLFNTINSTPIWTCAGLGDEVQCVAFSRNGNILAAASWGDIASAHNDMLVWKISTMSSDPIFGANAAGSAFWCSISNDGSTVTFSGKKVHARTFGNGGEAYNMYIDTNDVLTGINVNNNSPFEYRLSQNYPNPFNPTTKISYELQTVNDVHLSVFDILGREVVSLVNQKQNAGKYEVQWDAANYPSGIYFYTLTAGDFKDTRKMILMK
jgi:hypothetical protein